MKINNRILIVDDNELIHKDFQKALASRYNTPVSRALDAFEEELFGIKAPTPAPEYQLASAFQGKEGYEMALAAHKEGSPFALAFIDVRMPPGWDGIKTAGHLLQEVENLEIVLCSAFTDYSWEEITELLGENDRVLFLRKPFDPVEVKQMALALTNKWSLRRVNLEHTRDVERARLLAEAANREKSEFLSNMSHEIRTPLNGVIGMANLLAQTEMTDEQREYVKAITYSADVLLDLINDILDFSKIEAGKVALELIDFNLRTTIADIMRMFQFKFEEANLSLQYQFAPGVPNWINGDPTRIRQILMNFLSNALKFTTKGGVMLRLELDEQPEADSDEIALRFEVKDTGIGISEMGLTKLFQSFSQVDSSTTRKYGGTGLGLVISKKLALMMGGHVGVHSKLGEGSTFWFTAKVTKSIPPSMESVPQGDVLAGRRALVFGSDKADSTELVRQLSEWGIHCKTVDRYSDLVTILDAEQKAESNFDLLIADYPLTKLDGDPLSERLRKRVAPATRNSVALVREPRPGDAAQVERAGFAAFLPMPVSAEDLKACLEQLSTRNKDGSTEKANAFYTRHRGQESQTDSIPSILLAEDNPVNQKVVLHLLRKAGYACDVAHNGREVLDAVRRRGYDLILMDCQMPEMDGFQATEKVRQMERDDRHTPIVALTANAIKGDREKCLAHGMDDYLTKPVRQKALLTVIQKWLAHEGSASVPDSSNP
ncbi:Response regulator [Sulfidibacter corallicola]|uniref:Sensory/regulatory protein RpfC n=1 Tax=Sulfidibacter corallicola TaxID=2818388 RepID=A0A8A4TP16_SULCO|nr:response regulator [Sulfidibacter corallicola]QTD48335.1 response regulator [Sulfidibacter corallicola]